MIYYQNRLSKTKSKVEQPVTGSQKSEEGMSGSSHMDPELFNMVLDTLSKLEKEKLTLGVKLEMDKAGVFPSELIRFMLGPEVALHLIFIPAEYGGLGAGAREIAVISEKMAKMDMAVATSFLAICLGMDPIMVGATPAQREKWVRKIADEGLIVAYGVTEPEEAPMFNPENQG
jgi:alkylation response protein AidB-like acyl-CoA dehydrogenase